MRVSKAIRTYIEDRVNEKYANRIKAASAKYHEEQDEITEELRGLIVQANEQAKMLLEERYPGFVVQANEQAKMSFEGRYPGWANISFSYNVSNSKAYSEARRAVEALKRERDEHVSEIIVNLELGDNRAELEEMLAKI